jgi:uncharacterized protein
MLSTNFRPGAPNWVDLGTSDTAAAAAFYGALFGWEFRSAGPDAGGYGMFTKDGKTVAAAGPLAQPGAAPSWTLYFYAPDADATADAVRTAGGTVRTEPMDIGPQGRMAQFSDPAGAEFAVWQPGRITGLEAVNDAGTLCWTELHTTDVAAAAGFYASVFGWASEDAPMGDFSYTVLRPADGDGSSGHGGIMPIGPAMAGGAAAQWWPYFEVADCDATLTEAVTRGGTVIVAIQHIPGVGQFAMLADPAGAPFAIITSSAS